MKKYLFMAALLCMGCVCLTSCGDDDDELGSGKAGAVPAPTITDANGNKVQVTSIGNFSFGYDEQGKLRSFTAVNETFEIEGNKFILNSETEDWKSSINIALNGKGYISTISYKTSRKSSDGENEVEEGKITCSYNGNGQMTGVSESSSFLETDIDNGKQVGTWSGNSTSKCNITWKNENLTDCNFTSNETEKGSFIEDGKKYTENESTKGEGKMTFTYGSEKNPARQLPFVMCSSIFEQTIEVGGDIGVFAVIGLYGVGPAYLPESYTCYRKWVETEDGEEDIDEENSSRYFRFDINKNNGTIATEYISYSAAGNYNQMANYNYVGTRTMLDQARKFSLILHKRSNARRHHHAK
ncbi:MAG: hypothetical protein K5945_11200 [Bacteroidaceae bacterium]|nr:hypothetical protein [Bacteroidaceae bacterium]